MNVSWKILTVPALALALFIPATPAEAGVAANTRIVAEATLTYDDGTGTLKTSRASVTVTVTLLPAPGALSAPGDRSAVYARTDTETGYNYAVTAGGNGPDDYTLEVAVVDASNATGYSAEIRNIALDILLGATVTTVGCTALDIHVPSDGNADGEVNGIAEGDSVVIGDEVREVRSVDDPATGTATLVLETSLPAAPEAGASVREQKTFDVAVLSGTIDNAGQSILLTVETSVTNSAGRVADQVINSFTSGAAVLTKFARNVTDASANSGGTGERSFTIGGSTAAYYRGGLQAVQNDQIEYLLLVENTGTAPVDGCNIHDLLPLEYVELVDGAFGGDLLYIDESGNQTPLSAAADADRATVSEADLALYVGTGADPAAAAGGSIDAGKNVLVLYRVRVR